MIGLHPARPRQGETPPIWRAALHLDAWAAGVCAAGAQASGQPRRELAAAAAWGTLATSLIFLFMASIHTGVAALSWLGLALSGGILLHIAGLQPEGPPRDAAASPALRLLHLSSAAAALALMAFVPGDAALLLVMAALPPVLWAVALHLEALPPAGPGGRGGSESWNRSTRA